MIVNKQNMKTTVMAIATHSQVKTVQNIKIRKNISYKKNQLIKNKFNNGKRRIGISINKITNIWIK